MKALLIAAALAVAGTASAQMCPGDQDGSRSVTVDEILATVNASLSGCVAPEYACPYSLASDFGGFGCFFEGHANDTCRDANIRALLGRERGTGDLIVAINDGVNTVFVLAAPIADSTTLGVITHISHDSGRTFLEAAGIVYLNGDASLLGVMLEGVGLQNAARTRLGGCFLRHFIGAFEQTAFIGN